MNIKIDCNGTLHIQRADKYWKEQMCPFVATAVKWRTQCGDWCPLFGEPNTYQTEPPISDVVLCHRILSGTITDERGKE